LDEREYIVNLTVTLATSALAVLVSLGLRSDPLHVILEMYLVASCGVLFTVIGLTLHTAKPLDQGETQVASWRWVDFLTGTTMIFFQTSFLVLLAKYSTRYQRKRLVLGRMTAEEALEEVRANPRLLNLLRLYMQKELSYENLHFVEEVDTWKRHYEQRREGVQRAALCIYQTFISRKAIEQINIPDHVRSRCESFCLRGNVPITVFDNAIAEAMQMIKYDTLPRFLRSQTFLKAAGDPDGLKSPTGISLREAKPRSRFLCSTNFTSKGQTLVASLDAQGMEDARQESSTKERGKSPAVLPSPQGHPRAPISSNEKSVIIV
jgi:hypothetical protein